MKKIYTKPEARVDGFEPVDVICVSIYDSLERFLRGNLAEDYGKQKADMYDQYDNA